MKVGWGIVYAVCVYAVQEDHYVRMHVLGYIRHTDPDLSGHRSTTRVYWALCRPLSILCGMYIRRGIPVLPLLIKRRLSAE